MKLNERVNDEDPCASRYSEFAHVQVVSSNDGVVSERFMLTKRVFFHMYKREDGWKEQGGVLP